MLERVIDEEPEPPDVLTAIRPLAQLGVDVGAVQAAVDRYLSLSEGDWHPDDWRRSHPDFPRKYAAAAYIFTREDLGIYRVLGTAMHDTVGRAVGPGGVSPRMRACLPLIKLLDVGLVEAARLWGFFEGETLRGVKYAWPRPDVGGHDPTRHFPTGREFHWFEFNSSSRDPMVMYRPYFCGRRGPRTIFYIQSCEGVSIKKFSAIPDEDEVLFRPLSRFRVTGCTKHLTEGDLRDDVHPDNGFPDRVQLQQLPSHQEPAVGQLNGQRAVNVLKMVAVWVRMVAVWVLQMVLVLCGTVFGYFFVMEQVFGFSRSKNTDAILGILMVGTIMATTVIWWAPSVGGKKACAMAIAVASAMVWGSWPEKREKPAPTPIRSTDQLYGWAGWCVCGCVGVWVCAHACTRVRRGLQDIM